jgi:uncharacterized protein YhjY with autotransporter beta-barrel domain
MPRSSKRFGDIFASRRLPNFLKAIPAAAFLTAIPHAEAQVQIPLTGPANNAWNTGVGANGALLNSQNVAPFLNQLDPHYTFTTTPLVPGNPTGQTFQAYVPTLPNNLPANWVPNTATSEWITVLPSQANAHGPTQTFDYHLTLTNIPVGAEVHLLGRIADDDNATISATGTNAFFSNFSTGVVNTNFTTFQTITPIVFVAGANNTVTIAVSNVGGFSTGINFDLAGSYYTALTTTHGIQITPAGLTQNQTAVINTINQINSIGTTNSCFINLTTSLLASDPAAIGGYLDQLSPEKLGIFSSIAFNDASFRTQNLDDYTAHRRNSVGELQVSPGNIDFSGLSVTDPTMDPALNQVRGHLLAWSPRPSPGLLSDSGDPLTALVTGPGSGPVLRDDPMNDWNFFVSGDVVLGQNFSQPEQDHTDYNTSAFQIGTDYQIGKHFLVGVLFDYSHTDTTLDQQGSGATVDSYSPGLFASFAQDGWFANALGTYTRNAYTESRHVEFGTYDETANGAPSGDQETANLDGGYEFHSKDKKWTYGPTAGIQYTHLGIDSFSESGGCSSDLGVASQSDDSLRSRFGGRVSYAMFDHDNRVIFTPYIDASWQHEWLGGSRVITSSFQEVSPITFNVSTPQASRDSALISTGFDADITKDMTLFTGYAVQCGENDYFGQSITAGMKIAF